MLAILVVRFVSIQYTCFGLCDNWDSIKGICEILQMDIPKEFFTKPRECIFFEPYIDGDGVKRVCGAVGHGCEECYIHCLENPDPWYGGREEEEDLDVVFL